MHPNPCGSLLRRSVSSVVLTTILSLIVAVGSRAEQTPANPALPPLAIPPDNPQSEAKIALGAQLYFDPRLSVDNSISCATCHAPETAWANHDKVDTGVGGRMGTRNSGTVVDAAYMTFQFWDGRAHTLEEQALGPIHNPVEMGETLEHAVRKLNAIAGYKAQFHHVFGTAVTADGIAKAIAAFERTVLSGPSPYDRFVAGDRAAMSESAMRGLELFGGQAGCSACHAPPMFSDQSFHNIGVGMGRSTPDIGRESVTNDPADRGKFKTPALRNVALTWPYLHDGSAATLDDVVELYDSGGVPNPTLDRRITPLGLTVPQQKDLVAFLRSLTGTLPRIERPVLPK